MKKVLAIFVILGLCLYCMGAVNKGVTFTNKDKSVVFYWELTADFNDANTLVSIDNRNKTFEFNGTLADIFIDPNGSDVFTVKVLIDPPEPMDVAVSTKLYSVWEEDVDAADTNDFFYPIEVTSSASNVYAGPKVVGKVYIGIASASTSSLDNVKVYLYGKTE